MIRLTEISRNGSRAPVVINPAFISRISVPPGGPAGSVIDISGQTYASWVVEGPDTIYQMIKESEHG